MYIVIVFKAIEVRKRTERERERVIRNNNKLIFILISFIYK